MPQNSGEMHLRKSETETEKANTYSCSFSFAAGNDNTVNCEILINIILSS